MYAFRCSEEINMKKKPQKKIDATKILEWYCREGYGFIYPNCDKCDKNINPCFNYKILREMLNIAPFH